MFQLSLRCEKCAAAGHNSVIGKQLLFANRDRLVVLGLSQNGACSDLFENFSENSFKGDLPNYTTLTTPRFSLVNTFKLVFIVWLKVLLYVSDDPAERAFVAPVP
jgi:hypothetical protein